MQIQTTIAPPVAAAAKALIEVPAGIAAVAAMVAMQKTMAGATASISDLVTPMLEKSGVDKLGAAMSQAIDGAIAVDASLESQRTALTQARTAVTALVVASAADTAQQDPQAAMNGFSQRLVAAAKPLFEVAAQLDPSLVVPGDASQLVQ